MILALLVACSLIAYTFLLLSGSGLSAMLLGLSITILIIAIVIALYAEHRTV
jgi:hypothetical protein